MNVLYVTQYYSSKPTHASTVTTYEIVSRLAMRGHEVVVVSADSPGAATILDNNAKDSHIVKVLPVPSFGRKWYDGFSTLLTHTFAHVPLFVNALVVAKFRKKFNVIISMYHPTHMATLSAYLLARVLKVPLVVKIHDFIVDTADPHILRKAYKIALGRVNSWVLRKCDAILIQSPEWKAMMRDQSGVDEERLVVYPNGVDASFFQPHVDSEGLREELGLEGKRGIIFLGGMYRQRHPELLVKAIPEVVSEIENVEVLFLGEGPEIPRLSSLAESLGISDFVRFMGSVDHSMVPKFISLADVAVAPLCVTSRPLIYGSIQLTVLEYMACGKPVVVCRGATSESLVRDGHNSFVVHPGDIRGLSSAIVKLIGDENLSKRIGLNAREYVEGRYDWTILIDRLEMVLNSLVYKAD